MFWPEQNYDVLPALAVRGKNLRHSLRLVTIAWMWGVVWAVAVSGDQMRAFCRMIGFNDFAFGLMGAIPFISTLGQLPAAILVERTGLRKNLFLSCQMVARLLWMLLAVVPIIFWPGQGGSLLAVAAALGIMFISNFLAHLATPPWWTWMGDLIPRRIRGRYFGKRTQLATVTQIVAVIVISLIMRHVSGGATGGNENAVDNRSLLITICVIFGVGALFGAVDIWLFSRIREIRPPRQDSSLKPVFDFRVRKPDKWTATKAAGYSIDLARQVTWQVLLDPLRDRVFRNYVCYGAVITFSMTCCGWFYWKFASETLGFGALGSNVVFMAVGPLAATISSPWWGRMIDRWGRRPTLVVATILMAVAAVPWLVMGPRMTCPTWISGGINVIAGATGELAGWLGQAVHWAYPAYSPSPDKWVWVTSDNCTQVVPFLLASLGCVMGAASGTAVGLAQSAIILGFSDGTGRSKFVAASSVLINIGGAIGGIVGGIVAQKFQDVTLYLGPIVMNNYQMTFALGLLTRVLSLGWLVNMPDPGARKMRDMLKVWTDNAFTAVGSRMFYTLRIFGWGSHDGQPGSRRRRREVSDKPAGKRDD